MGGAWYSSRTTHWESEVSLRFWGGAGRGLQQPLTGLCDSLDKPVGRMGSCMGKPSILRYTASIQPLCFKFPPRDSAPFGCDAMRQGQPRPLRSCVVGCLLNLLKLEGPVQRLLETPSTTQDYGSKNGKSLGGFALCPCDGVDHRPEGIN